MLFCTGLYAQDSNYERVKPVIEHLKQSNLLSDDIKAGCRNRPEFFYQLAVEFIELTHLVAIRPDEELVDAALEKVNNGNIDVVSFFLLYNCFLSYGEAIIWNGKLQEIYGEKVKAPHDWTTPYFMQKEEFKSSLEKIHDIYREIGKHMEWEWKKINDEIEKFDTDAASYLLNHFEACRVYASIFYEAKYKEIDNDLTSLQARIEAVKKEQETIAVALIKKKEQNIRLQRQCAEVPS